MGINETSVMSEAATHIVINIISQPDINLSILIKRGYLEH